MIQHHRHAANPFSTCWIRPDRCSYRFPSAGQPGQLMEGLLRAGGGQVVGPHGVGKSTLLFTLQAELMKRGYQVARIQLHAGQRRLAPWGEEKTMAASSWLIVDGFEQLPAWRRWKLVWQCRRRRVRLLVSSHRCHRFPFTWQLAPGPELACSLVDDLQQEIGNVVTSEDVEQLFREHQGNIRELLFDCYDLFETRTRRLRQRQH